MSAFRLQGYPPGPGMVHTPRDETPPREWIARIAMPKRLALLFCVALAAPVLGVPASAIAGPAQAEGARVRVVIDAEELGEAGPFFQDKVGATLRAAVEQAGYQLEDGIRADATVRVRISFFNEADLDYQVHVEISAGAELVQLETLDCAQCVDDDLLGKIDDQHAQVLAGLERALALVQQRPQPANEDDPPVEGTKQPKAIGALGYGGIGVAALGIGALVAGGVEFGRGKIYDDRTRIANELTFVDHRPVGGALLGVGGVVVAAGVTMLVVDLVRASKRRQQPHAGLAIPLLGPSMLGLGYSGQF